MGRWARGIDRTLEADLARDAPGAASKLGRSAERRSASCKQHIGHHAGESTSAHVLCALFCFGMYQSNYICLPMFRGRSRVMTDSLQLQDDGEEPNAGLNRAVPRLWRGRVDTNACIVNLPPNDDTVETIFLRRPISVHIRLALCCNVATQCGVDVLSQNDN